MKKNILFIYPPSFYVNHSMFKHFTYFAETIDVLSRYCKDIVVIDGVVEKVKQNVLYRHFTSSDWLILPIEPYNYEASVSLINSYKTFYPQGKVVVYGTLASLIPNYLSKNEQIEYIVPHGSFAYGILSAFQIEYPQENIISEICDIIVNRDNKVKREGHFFRMDSQEWGIATNSFVPLKLYKEHNNGMFEVTVQTGCPFNCSFCSEKVLFKDNGIVQHRPVNNIIDILKQVKDSFESVYFSATTFTINKKWVTKLCQAMIDNDCVIPWRTDTRIDCIDRELLILMKQSGLQKISFGIETFDDNLLKSIHKQQQLHQIKETIALCKEIDVSVKALLILGIPGQTRDEVFSTVAMIKEQDIEYRFKEYSPISELHKFDAINDYNSIENLLHSFDRNNFRTNSIKGISSTEYLNLLFPQQYKR